MRAEDGRTVTEDYLAVVFLGYGKEMEFGKEWDVYLRLWNPAADYSKLVPGATFTIRESSVPTPHQSRRHSSFLRP